MTTGSPGADAETDDGETEAWIHLARQMIGEEGGRIDFEGGYVDFPPGALLEETEIVIEKKADDSDITIPLFSSLFRFGPTLMFLRPVKVGLDFSGTENPIAFWSPVGREGGPAWGKRKGYRNNSLFEFYVSHFSWGGITEFWDCKINCKALCQDETSAMGEPYVWAVTGNGRMSAGISKTGDLVSLYFPYVGSFQLIPYYEASDPYLDAFTETTIPLGFGNVAGIKTAESKTIFSSAGEVNPWYQTDTFSGNPTTILEYRSADPRIGKVIVFIPMGSDTRISYADGVVIQVFEIEQDMTFFYRPRMEANVVPRDNQICGIPLWWLGHSSSTSNTPQDRGDHVFYSTQSSTSGRYVEIGVGLQILPAGSNETSIAFQDPKEIYFDDDLIDIIDGLSAYIDIDVSAGDSVAVYTLMSKQAGGVDALKSALSTKTIKDLRDSTILEWRDFLGDSGVKQNIDSSDDPQAAGKLIRNLFLTSDERGGISASPTQAPKYFPVWPRD
ncbi:MAG: hypothetical protein ABIJ56_06685, partial [Pseudomonadota bacterium]